MSAIAFPSLAGRTSRRSALRGAQPEITWGEIAQRAPLMASTMATYLDQLSVSARPGTVAAFDIALRFFAGRVTEADGGASVVADVERRHIEDFKLWQAARPGKRGKLLSTTTIRHRLGLLRTFFERIIEWGYDDAPARVPIFPGTSRRPTSRCPSSWTTRTMARFMAAVAADPNPRRRLMIELLARTGMRVGELAALEDDAMVQISETFWLRIPVGKLHNDRYVPLHPDPGRPHHRLPENPRAEPLGPPGRPQRRPALRPPDHPPLCGAVAKRAGIGHVHPHQLRHTLATQAINRGMSLEAIAALLGHRSMRMTMTYARISDRTVADEYFRVTEAVEANYGTHRSPAGRRGGGRTCAGWPPTIGGCSATACAPGPPPSTAPSSQPASAAPSSRPDPSSSRSSGANGTTPPNTTRPTGSSSSRSSSTTSTGTG